MAKEVEFFKLDFKVLDGSRSYANVIGVAMVVVRDDNCCGFVWLIERAVSPAPDSELS